MTSFHDDQGKYLSAKLVSGTFSLRSLGNDFLGILPLDLYWDNLVLPVTFTLADCFVTAGFVFTLAVPFVLVAGFATFVVFLGLTLAVLGGLVGEVVFLLGFVFTTGVFCVLVLSALVLAVAPVPSVDAFDTLFFNVVSMLCTSLDAPPDLPFTSSAYACKQTQYHHENMSI